MRRDLLQRRRQLDAVRGAFDRHEPLPRGLTGDVGDSWRRCALAVPVARTPLTTITDPDGIWADSPVRRAAPELIEELGRLAVGEDYVAAVTDDAGTIIWSSAGRSMARLAEKVNFVRGVSWNEGVAGTNAPGLALHTGRPATVFAGEHWCESVQDWVCYAAPIRSSAGHVVGILDLSTLWRRASPLALTTVTAMARLVEQELKDDRPATPQVLCVRVLGHPHAELHGQPAHFSQRQLEILTILAVHGATTLEELHDMLYGERPVAPATLKAEISHLRRLLGGAIESRPYRLRLSVDVDVVSALAATRDGRLDEALRLYTGQLLPTSESPFVTDLRHHLDAALRSAVLADGRPSQILQFADVHPFDVAVLERARAIASPGDPINHELAARMERARR